MTLEDRPLLDVELSSAIVVQATGRDDDFVRLFHRHLSTPLGKLGVLGTTGVNNHKGAIQSVLAKLGYRIKQADIDSASDVTIATCAFSVMNHAC